MKTETLTKTIILPLKTSQRKNERLQHCIKEWQSIAKTVANHHASFPEYDWGRTTQNPSWYRIIQREHDDAEIHSQGKLAALHKVGSSFQSWRENGQPGNHPKFGDGNYCRFTNQGVELVENDGGYGLKVKLEAYDPEWWHIKASDYHREFCKQITNGELKLGAVELQYDDTTESVAAHVAVSTDIAVTEWNDVETTVGVDLGENALYAAVAVSDSIETVEIECGAKYRHYRERLKAERKKLQEQGERRKAHSARTRYEDYTDHIMHVASRQIIELAGEHENPGIVLEDLTDYRSTADNPIHDWPYQNLQEKISYKATELGIPVKVIDPAYTSQTCRKCGYQNTQNRNGTEFYCRSCGYEVHADVNAAINLANKTVSR